MAQNPAMLAVTGWKPLMLLAVLFPVAGFVLLPLALGSDGAQVAHVVGQGIGLGAAVVFGASGLAMWLRRHGEAPSAGVPASIDAPPTVHSAPTQFDPDLTVSLDTDPALEALPQVAPEAPALAAAPASWSLELLHALEWCRFERLCAGYYREKGIAHVPISLAANGGMDIYLFQDEARPKRATAVVHARARGLVHQGVQGVRELIGVMAHERIERAFFMTNGYFTPEAKALGHLHNIVLVDARVLLAMIARLPEAQQACLLQEVTEGDYTTPTCPMCGHKMQRASGSHGDYWGCARHPACGWMMPVLPA
jgi:restriction system protein